MLMVVGVLGAKANNNSKFCELEFKHIKSFKHEWFGNSIKAHINRRIDECSTYGVNHHYIQMETKLYSMLKMLTMYGTIYKSNEKVSRRIALYGNIKGVHMIAIIQNSNVSIVTIHPVKRKPDVRWVLMDEAGANKIRASLKKKKW